MGLWYYHSYVDDSKQKEIHERLEEPHRLLHGAAVKIHDALKISDKDTVKAERENLDRYYKHIADIFDEYLSFLEAKALES